MKEWFFHVRHNARPSLIQEVLLLLNECENPSVEDIINLGAIRGYSIGTSAKSAQSIKENPIQEARDLGLVDLDKLTLTDLGENAVKLLSVKSKVFVEYVHFLHYSLWDPKIPHLMCSSWSYRTICNVLWDASTTEVNRTKLADQLANIARAKFQIENISLSERSIEGITKWLDELEPPVFKEEKIDGKKVRYFHRRDFCSPEIFALALDYVYRNNQVAYQTNMMLDVSKIEELCKVLILDPVGFDNTVDWACGQYDFINQGSSGGWGRYIRLSRPPHLSDFMG